MIDFLTTHYLELLAVAMALLGLINRFVTAHPDSVGHPVARALLVALDVVSWLQSRESSPGLRGPLGRVKLPGQLSPPAASPPRARTSTMREGVPR